MEHNEIIISKTLLENVSSSCSKIEISIQLNPHDTELKSFFADVSTETNSNGTETNKFIGPIVIFLKAELTDTYEEKLSSLSSQEEKVRNVSVCFQVLIECWLLRNALKSLLPPNKFCNNIKLDSCFQPRGTKTHLRSDMPGGKTRWQCPLYPLCSGSVKMLSMVYGYGLPSDGISIFG